MENIILEVDDDAKMERISNAIAGLFPIPMIPDPKKEGRQIPTFTKKQWVKECLRLWLIKQVARYEQKIAQDAIKYSPEDTLIA